MTRQEYKAERQLRGTQGSVASQLGVRRATVADREGGKTPVNQEASLALCALPKKRKR